jgi:hypothetical protein
MPPRVPCSYLLAPHLTFGIYSVRLGTYSSTDSRKCTAAVVSSITITARMKTSDASMPSSYSEQCVLLPLLLP